MIRGVRRTTVAGPVRVLAFCLALGITTGLVHVVVFAVRRVVLGEFTWMPRAIVWMAPVAYAILFAAPAVVLAALHWRWPVYWSGRRLFVGPFVLAASALALLAYGIHPLALLVLAVGAGVRLSSLAAAREQALHDRLWPWLGSVAAITLLLGVGEQGWRTMRERLALAAVPAAAAASPNVLLLILDTVRAQNLSLYGYHRPTTPVLDSLAASSVVFSAAYSPSSWTLPSHGSVFTGRGPFALDVNWFQPYDGSDPTLAEHFGAAGYATGGFVGNLLYTTYESGLERGFQHYDDYRISLRQILLTSSLLRNRLTHDLLTARSWEAFRGAWQAVGTPLTRNNNNDRKVAPEVVEAFLAWQATRDRPFFAFLNFFDAHQPYDAPGPWRSAAADEPTLEDYYDGGIARIDEQVGILLDSLRRRSVLDRTIVIVTSDHGELFGEHGVRGHGNSLYTQVTRVPLLLLPPAGRGGGGGGATSPDCAYPTRSRCSTWEPRCSNSRIFR